uniref:Putative polya-specific ribonuclease parn n=1 Tax=Ixodes ricinus TaxID=34613 RepID=A0A147BQL9_IXORI
MEVTIQNFSEQLEVLKTVIKDASFLSIDCEFTGLHTQRSVHVFDSAAERYDKLREFSQEFLVIQVGLCTFQYDKEKSGYLCRAFNFFTCPRQILRGSPDRIFRCQASSLQFLSQHGFDFNKLFAHGIPYLKPAEVERLSKALEERHAVQMEALAQNGANAEGNRPKAAVPKEIQPFVDDVLESVERFLKAADDDGTPSAPPKEGEEGGIKGDEGDGVLHLAECDPFRRKLIYQEVKARFGEAVVMETQASVGGARHVVVRRAGPVSQQTALLEEKQRKEMADLEKAHGFGRLLEVVAQSGKLVVGHNMVLDVVHLLSQFVDDLPKDYQEFKSMVKATFPGVVDTKLLATEGALKDVFSSTMLGALVKQLGGKSSSLPPIEFVPGYGYDSVEEKLHEAGYDAYITGLCMAGLCQRLRGKGSESPAEEINARSAVLKPYLNRMYLMQSMDIPSLELDRDEVQPVRDHVLHLTFPKEWRTSDLMQLLHSYGYVTVHWLNDTEALVALPTASLAAQAAKQLKNQQAAQKLYRVQTFAEFAGRAGKQDSPSAKPFPSVDTAAAGVTATRVEADETAVPRKRKRSSSLGSAIPTIPEEDEISDSPNERKAKKKPQPEPQSPAKPQPKAQLDKLFEENDDWS